MRQTTAFPKKGPALVCGSCGLKSYPPVVIECAQLKGEQTPRLRCADVAACAIRVRRTARFNERTASR